MRGLALVALVAATLGTTACAAGHRAVNPPTELFHPTDVTPQAAAAKVARSSRLVLGGRVRCTASVASTVSAGQELGVTFVFRNVSGGPVKVQFAWGATWLVVRSPDLTTYDTRVPLREGIGGIPFPVTIAPGATRTVPGPSVPVSWRGPLRVTPGCEQSRLPTRRVAVAAPGPPRDESTAIADVVGAAAHLFDRCRPWIAGIPVQGEIDAPDASAPPLRASCSVSLKSEGRFWVAQALALIPPGLKGVRFPEPYGYGSFSMPKLPAPFEAIEWEFVVTKDGATSIGGQTVDATKGAPRMAPGWALTSELDSNTVASTSRCGYRGFDGMPFVDFISVCPA